RPARIERVLGEPELGRVAHLEGDGKARARGASTRLRNHRLARVDAGDSARGPDALSDVEGIRPGAATQVEHMQAGPQVQALEDYRFAFLDVWDCVALVQEANEEIGVTSAIHLGEQRHVLAHGSLLLLCPARPAQ